MTNTFILEIAVETVAAAEAAERAGADRIELCADLQSGGVTPSLLLMRQVRHALKLPIFTMIRPRTGNYVHSTEELAAMKRSLAVARAEGMDGVVLGILLSDSKIDVPRTKELIECARPIPVTFHRAFDDCPDLQAAMEDAIRTGATRILTSGGAPTAAEGSHNLRLLVEAAGERITIVPGGGISPKNFAAVRQGTGAKEFHSGLGSVVPYGDSDTSLFEKLVGELAAEKKSETF